ncbi:DUF934 domain-containing protein [Anderseniella sp. Alg231-50]|uniref:DUF934 domain-containing protein n=1 Tax=Anderseniella sp. Alg231-50 TaxID=1922226 RepID=UPI000D555BB7
MPVIENNTFVDDAWTHLQDGDSATDRSMIIVPLARLEEVLADWPADHRGLGVDVPNDVDVDQLTPHLARLDIVTLNFPGFADGRAFSQARSIRHTDHFSATIRARGSFLPDQYGFLLQSGVDSFEVSDRFALEEWVRHADTVPATYQRDYATGGLATRPFAEAGVRRDQPHYG